MNAGKYGSIILWMGLILMAMQIAAEWPMIRQAIFTNSSGSSGGGGFSIPPVMIPGIGVLSTPKANQVNVGAQFPTITPPPGRQG